MILEEVKFVAILSAKILIFLEVMLEDMEPMHRGLKGWGTMRLILNMKGC